MITEVFLEPCQTSMMKGFWKNNSQLLITQYFRKKLHRRCLTGSKYAFVLHN